MAPRVSFFLGTGTAGFRYRVVRCTKVPSEAWELRKKWEIAAWSLDGITKGASWGKMLGKPFKMVASRINRIIHTVYKVDIYWVYPIFPYERGVGNFVISNWFMVWKFPKVGGKPTSPVVGSFGESHNSILFDPVHRGWYCWWKSGTSS